MVAVTYRIEISPAGDLGIQVSTDAKKGDPDEVKIAAALNVAVEAAMQAMLLSHQQGHILSREGIAEKARAEMKRALGDSP